MVSLIILLSLIVLVAVLFVIIGVVKKKSLDKKRFVRSEPPFNNKLTKSNRFF